MSKAQKKQLIQNDKQQAKISSFFQAGGSTAANHSKASQLFGHIGQKSTTSTSTCSPNDQQQTGTGSNKSTKVTAVAESEDDSIIIPDTPQPTKTTTQSSTMLNFLSSTPKPKSCTSTSASPEGASPAAGVHRAAEDSDVIPDTPEPDSAGKPKRPFQRSFLSSSASFVPKAKPTKAEIYRLNRLRKSAKSLEERLKENAAKEFESSASATKWKNDDVCFTAATADLGISLHTVKPTNLHQQQAQNKLSKVSPGKRLRSLKRPSSKGESPNPKRPAKVSGLGAAQLGEARRKLLLSESDCVSNSKANEDKQAAGDTDSEGEDMEALNGCKIMVQTTDSTTFRWGKKKPAKSTMAETTDKMEEATAPALDDSTLSTILTEIKPHVTDPSPEMNSVPPVPRFKRQLTSVNSATSTKKTASDDIDLGGIDSDNALDDIMDQLRHTLAETPKYLKKTSPTKSKRLCSKKPFLLQSPRNTECHKSPNQSLDASVGCSSTETSPCTPSKQTGSAVEDLDVSTGASPSGQAEAEAEVQMDTAPCKAEETAEEICKSLSRDFSRFSPFKEPPDSTSEKSAPESASAGAHLVSPEAPVAAFARYKVLSVVDHGAEKVLELVSIVDGSNKWAVLHGFWLDTHVKADDTVHVIGDFSLDGQCHITDTSNLLVVNPDLLISGTTVVSTVQCMRRSVLNEKFKGCDSRSIYMLYGSIIHSFFQKVLEEQAFSKAAMEKIAKEIITQSQFLHDMYALGVTEAAILEEINKYLPTTLQFVEKYVPPKQYSLGQKQYPDVNVAITNIADIEENVWSPRYGIKGKIDLTVQVKIRKDRNSRWERKVMPLELKTGKPTHSVEHKGQVTLYSMMLADRRQDPEGGLLLYLKDGSLTNIPANYANKRGLIQLRNELAHYLQSSTEVCNDPTTEEGAVKFHPLPRPINSEHMCPRCPHLLNCTAYQRTMEEHELSASHQMSGLIPATLSHLAQAHLDYFKHWCTMLHLEAVASASRGTAQIRHIWCKTAEEREKLGECLSGLNLAPDQCKPVEGERFLQTFSRRPNDSRGSVSDVGLAKSDNVVVSAENKPLLSLCTGSIRTLDSCTVTILTDRDLRIDPDHRNTVFRLDKSDTFSTSSYYFTNLSRLMGKKKKVPTATLR